ncbi:hypothetical protein GCM10020366_04760 [Saccharopolyspora gregorii]|uniref:Uncharacterized protein n=1 Tax=Saccharopolyspora gregorii TaxID=33914 RepID=A0ABP6RJ71_9PSEU
MGGGAQPGRQERDPGPGREAGFSQWTLLKPAFFMANFLPSMGFLFPRGVEGGLVSVLKPDTRCP